MPVSGQCTSRGCSNRDACVKYYLSTNYYFFVSRQIRRPGTARGTLLRNWECGPTINELLRELKSNKLLDLTSRKMSLSVSQVALTLRELQGQNAKNTDTHSRGRALTYH